MMTALDSNVFIYALEGNREFGEYARYILTAIANGILAGNACELAYPKVLTGSEKESNVRVVCWKAQMSRMGR